MNQRQLQAKIDSYLPPGTIGYFGPPKALWKFMIISPDMEHKYFEKTYDLRSYDNNRELFVAMMKDVEEFNKIWNSPLAKALR